MSLNVILIIIIIIIITVIIIINNIYIRKGSHARLAKGYVMFFAFAYKGGSLRASFDVSFGGC